jgi:hypothetical protein
MKVLLDECIPRRFKQSLSGHECRTVPEVVLAGKKNGELLTLAEAAGYEVFLTIDRGIEHEQNLRGRAIAIIVIRAKSTRRPATDRARHSQSLGFHSSWRANPSGWLNQELSSPLRPPEPLHCQNKRNPSPQCQHQQPSRLSSQRSSLQDRRP